MVRLFWEPNADRSHHALAMFQWYLLLEQPLSCGWLALCTCQDQVPLSIYTTGSQEVGVWKGTGLSSVWVQGHLHPVWPIISFARIE